MKVGIDVTALQIRGGRHGVGSYLRGLLGALERVAPAEDYALVAWTSPALDTGPLGPSFRVAGLPGPPRGRTRALVAHQWGLVRLCRRLGLDVLHVPSVSTNASLPGVPLLQPVPVVVTVQDLIPLRFPAEVLPQRRHRLFYRAQLRAVRRAAHVLCPSRATREELVRRLGLRLERITLAPLAADPCFSAEPRPPGDDRANGLAARPFVLHVGGAAPTKNLPALLRAMAGLWSTGRATADLVCVAPEPLRPSGLGAAAHADRVHVLSEVGQPFLRWLYQHARVLAVPSRDEGFGLPVLEALAWGCPVVASCLGSLPEVGGDAALYADPDDAAAWAAALGRVLDDPGLAADLSARGRRRAAGFGYDATARATHAVYQRVSQR
jgi:alpha-1,3-rhamnosyl/mannosyltransferase